MTNNPTIDGVSRELIQRAIKAIKKHHNSLAWVIASDLECAIRDAPVVERQEPVMKLEAERLLCGDGEYAVSFVKPGWLNECRNVGGEFLLYTAPPDTGAWRPLESAGQIQQGDWLSFTVAGSFFCAQAKLIIDPGTDKEEIVYHRQKNHYFVTSMAVDGTSTHKGVLVARQKKG